MADKKKKTDLILAAEKREQEQEPAQARREQDLDELLPARISGAPLRRTESKRIRKLNPMGMRVVVLLRKDANVSEGGLYLPEGAKEAAQESLIAEVLEVASAIDADTEEETNVSGIPLGATVLIPRGAGVKVPWDESLRIVETKDILAVINEISIT